MTAIRGPLKVNLLRLKAHDLAFLHLLSQMKFDFPKIHIQKSL